MDRSVADAYSAGARGWADGPVQIYGTLAELLLASAPISLQGRRLLDLGTGTGAASRPAVAAGAHVTAIDNAFGMVQTDRAARPPAVVADAVVLPIRAAIFDVVVAAFSLNHLHDPAAGVREAARIVRTGGILLASTYAHDDDHPVKQAVESALHDAGWEMPAWYPEMKRAMAAWGTVDDARAAVERGGMEAVSVEHRDIGFPDLDRHQLVRWRLGMAQHAAFVESLDGRLRADVVQRAVELLGPDVEPLVRRVIFITARAR
jgi:SAM-dependent methyltransferase